MHGKLAALALSSLVASAQAAPVLRRYVPDAEAVAEILPDGTTTATAFLPDDGLLAHAIVARDGASPLAGILSLVNGILDGLDPILGAGAVNATEAALATLAGLLLVEDPDAAAAASGNQTQYVMAAATNQSTPVFLVTDTNGTTTDSATSAGKTLVTIHIPILDETTGQMTDSCLTYDQDPVATSTLAAMPCTADANHASQRFMYDSTTGVVEPMFDGAGAMDLATQTPSYMVNAANLDTNDAPATNSSSVLIVFTPATDTVPMSTAALPLSRVESDDTGSGTMASADDGSASANAGDSSATASADGTSASTSGDNSTSDPDVQNEDANDGTTQSTGMSDVSYSQSTTSESDTPSQMTAEECADDGVNEQGN